MVGIIQLKDRSLKDSSVVWCKPPELRDVEDVDRSLPNAVSWTIQRVYRPILRRFTWSNVTSFTVP